MPGGRRWTEAADRQLLALLDQAATSEQIAVALDRTAAAVEKRQRVLGRCRRRLNWTAAEENKLIDWLEGHRNYASIARALGRTEPAVRDRAALLGIAARNANGRTVNVTAALLGLEQKTVAWWIREGWLIAHETGLRMSRGKLRVVEHDDLLVFLEDSTHWHLWEPGRIADRDLRDWASELRAGVRYLTTAEAGARLGLEHYAVCSLARWGRIRAVKRGPNWRIREEDCVYPDRLPQRPKGPSLTDEQRAFVRDWHGRRPGTWIAERLGCSDSLVYATVQELGLPRLGQGYWKRKQREGKQDEQAGIVRA